MDWKASPSKLSIPSIFQKSPTSNVTQGKTSVSRKTSSVDRPLKQETASSIPKSMGSLFKRADNNQATVKQTLISKSTTNVLPATNKNITENNDTDLQRKTSLIRKSNPSLPAAASPNDLKSSLRPVSVSSVTENTEEAKKNDASEFQRKVSTGLKPICFAFSIAANSADPKKIDKKSENTSLKSSFSKSVGNLSTDRTSTDVKITPVIPSTKFNMAAKSTSNLAPNSKLSSNPVPEKKSTSNTVVSTVMKSAENLLQTIKSKRESSDKHTAPSMPNIKSLAAQFSSTPIKKEGKNEETYQRNLSPTPSINGSFSRQTSVLPNSGKEEILSLPSSPFKQSFAKQNSISSNSDQEEKSPIPSQIKTLSSPSSPFTKSFPKQNSMFSASAQEEKSPKILFTYSPPNNTSNSSNADISGLSVLSTPKHQEKDTDVIVRRNLKSPQVPGDQSSTICFNFAKKNSTSTPDLSKTDKSTTKRESVELFGDKSGMKIPADRTVVYAENRQVTNEKIKPTGKTTEPEKTNIKMDTDDEIKKANVKILENETHRNDNINMKKDIIKVKEQTPEINKVKNINIHNENVISDMKSIHQDNEIKIFLDDQQIQSQEEITVTKKRTRAQTEICDEILNTIATRLNHEAKEENSVVDESVSAAQRGSVNKYCDDEKIYENIDVIRQHIAKKSRNDVPVGKCPVPSVRTNYLKLRRRTVFF